MTSYQFRETIEKLGRYAALHMDTALTQNFF